MGISPEMERLADGDRAFLARDFDGAKAAYQEAIKQKPQSPLGHLRMAEVHVHLGEFDAASEVLITALRFVGDDADLKARAFAHVALLRERQNLWDDALQSWDAAAPPQDPGSAGTTTAKAPASSPGAPADPKAESAPQAPPLDLATTADERRRAINAWKQAQADGAVVKARSEQRMKEAGIEPTSTAPATP